MLPFSEELYHSVQGMFLEMNPTKFYLSEKLSFLSNRNVISVNISFLFI